VFVADDFPEESPGPPGKAIGGNQKKDQGGHQGNEKPEDANAYENHSRTDPNGLDHFLGQMHGCFRFTIQN
jgi:hypothetical protein